MSEILSNIPLISELAGLVEWLLLLNIVLTGMVILLGFRVMQYKQRADDLESELNATLRKTIDTELTQQPLPRKRRS